MKLRLPPLNALRVFEVAARQESFTRAAEELSVTHGAVSRQVAALEEWVGAPLFDRLHRQVRLTRRGMQLRDELTACFVRIAAATERARVPVSTEVGATTLRLSAPPAFSVRWLIPRLPRFQQRHPEIDVSLSNSVAPPDFGSDAYDLAIRLFARAPRLPHVVKLFDECSVPVCHVDLIAAARLPLDWGELLRRGRLIRVAAEPRGWEKWARVWALDLRPARFVDVELTYLAVQAALEGLGVALLPRALVSDDMDRGVLTMPMGPMRIDGSGYHVVAPSVPLRRSPADRMIEWLRAEGSAAVDA
jgi:LysR family transcriptional regulator, glycine cleavage system transcriptional activator